MYAFYFLLGAVILWGARGYKRREWNEEYCSLGQTKILLGINAILIPVHHIAQKTCASWLDEKYIIPGLEVFVPVGHLLVAVFLFCSGLGLYKSFKSKRDYLKGFVKKRILPLVIAYYLSEYIYLLVRVFMGEKMSPKDVICYISGLHMANMNAWYLVAIVFFYAFFYLSFRFCRKEGTAILWMFVACVLYALLGAAVGHQNYWWIRGEWWYNSIILLPVGLLFARYEQKITAFFKKTYVFLLPFSILLTVGLYVLSEYVMKVWGYYGEYWGDPLLILHRLGCCLVQWLLCISYVAVNFLVLLKVRLGNGLLKLVGSVTLELYLMHGMFVELFGFDFLNEVPSIVYIKNVPLFILVVFACSVPMTFLFRLVWKKIVGLLGLKAVADKGEALKNN